MSVRDVVLGAAIQADRAIVGSFDPNITPNETGLPGIPMIQDLIGGMLSFCLFGSMAALIGSMLMWGWGRLSSSGHRVDTGKSATAWSLAAFIGFGMVNTITSWAWDVGLSVPLPGAQ